MFMRTERLFLRPVFPEDWRGVYRGIADENVVRNLARAPWPYCEHDARKFCADAQAGSENKFVITLPSEQGAPIIGMIGFGPRQDGGPDELGYWIGRAWQRRGFATEAVRGVIEVAEALGLKALGAGHYIDNPASGKVLRKAGFTETGEIDRTICMARGGEMLPTRRFVKWLGADADSYRPAAA
ncbi:GNAT family N-acetyltransferase [Aurantiacibacter sp. D1-12]|uniref:GNAT family N-acetyltransferase n=1 Tax=Aurantiacibacter sp. D1-12 TaxID=2993658 RepID=UPI00237C5D0D|nr:GNAT family N-acetyltransferase [Aurantiacibacter sp. D1-12]MDE1467873.1 GNAT family N-acetyltransferase [Aurantiacibacter sp. D1-12]